MSDEKPMQTAAKTLHEAFEPFRKMQNEMTQMHQETTRTFNDFWTKTGDAAPLPSGANLPAMRTASPAAVNLFGPMMGLPAADVSETDAAYILKLELPGLDAGEIDVSAKDGVLTISGEKKEEKREERENFYMSERRFGRFQRAFPLPPNVDADAIEKQLRKGVLTLTLPKTSD